MSYDVYPPKFICVEKRHMTSFRLLEFRFHVSCLGVKSLQTPILAATIGIFKPNSQNRNCHIEATTFYTTIKTTKCSSRVVHNKANMADGPAILKIEVCHDNANGPFPPYRPLIFRNFSKSKMADGRSFKH